MDETKTDSANIQQKSREIITKANAKVDKKVKIKSGEEVTVEIYPSKNVYAPKLLFKTNQWLKKSGFSAEIQEVPGNTATVKVVIKNVTIYKKVLFANRKIGTLTFKKS